MNTKICLVSSRFELDNLDAYLKGRYVFLEIFATWLNGGIMQISFISSISFVLHHFEFKDNILKQESRKLVIPLFSS